MKTIRIWTKAAAVGKERSRGLQISPCILNFQNDKNSRFNSNWVKIYLDGKIDNYEEKTIIFSEPELNDLKKWIHQNKETITKHYYQEYDSADVCKKIKPLT